jgi:hypothetical protein
VKLRERLEVATCIACHARTRLGECIDGCTDVPLDLVEAAVVDALAARTAALEARANAFGALLGAAAEDPGPDWEQLRRDARAALAIPVPEQPDAEIVPAWGCPDCGRIDAPQPCLDVCIRQPVLMADASELHALQPAAAAVEAREQVLARVTRLLAYARPRPGLEAQHRAELRRRARDVRKRSSPNGRRRPPGATSAPGPPER